MRFELMIFRLQGERFNQLSYCGIFKDIKKVKIFYELIKINISNIHNINSTY